MIETRVYFVEEGKMASRGVSGVLINMIEESRNISKKNSFKTNRLEIALDSFY